MAENTGSNTNITDSDSRTGNTEGGRRIRAGGLLTIGAAGAVAAAAVNAVIFGIGRAADVDFVVADGGTEETINIAMVVTMSLVTFAVGVVGALLAHRIFGPGSLRPMGVVGIVLALASNVTFPEAEATTSTKWTLAVMHMVVGVVYLASLEIVRSRTAGVADASVGEVDAAVTAPV